MSGRASFDLNGLLFVQQRPGSPAIPTGPSNEQANKPSALRAPRQISTKSASNRVAPLSNLQELAVDSPSAAGGKVGKKLAPSIAVIPLGECNPNLLKSADAVAGVEGEAIRMGGVDGRSFGTGQLVVGWTNDDVVREKLAGKSRNATDGDEDVDVGESSSMARGKSQERVTETEGYKKAAQTAHWTTARLRTAFFRRQSSLTMSESQQQFKELQSKPSLHRMRMPSSEQDGEQAGRNSRAMFGRRMADEEAMDVEKDEDSRRMAHEGAMNVENNADSLRRVTRGPSGHFAADKVAEIASSKETHQS